MIILVQGNDRDQYSVLMDEMFRLRNKVFSERLGWAVNTVGDWEIDHFDYLDPLYLLSIDEHTRRVRGCLRLLPTTGPNMLRDVFPELLPDGNVVESALIWESSRFCVDHEIPDVRGHNALRYVTGELLAGAIDVGVQAGLSFIVSVFDARMLRILRSAQFPAEVIGEPRQIGVCKTYAGLFETSERVLANISDCFGFDGSVLERSPFTRRIAA